MQSNAGRSTCDGQWILKERELFCLCSPCVLDKENPESHDLGPVPNMCIAKLMQQL